MTQRAPRTHWLRGNKGERTPRRVIFLDTESEQEEAETRELHTLRCWVMRAVTRPTEEHPESDCRQFEGTTRAQLMLALTATTRGRDAWRLFTHNLSYDLGLTRLPLDLLAAGWTPGRHNLASEQPWAHFAKGSRSLWLCDSWSWLPLPLETLGDKLGLKKPALPDALDPLEAWFHRCRRDVEILSRAMLDLMAEWDRRNLGWWSITGPASGWNTMLHFPARNPKKTEVPKVAHSQDPFKQKTGERVLIVPDAEARAFERQALYSGRRDVWRLGDLKDGPYAEIDLKNAHLTICAHLPLPYRRWAPFDALALDDWRLGNPAAGLTAEVVVRADSPRYPCRFAGAVLHPVGTFATTLAGPEILEARRRGDLISIGRGYGYHLGHTMADWASWALGILNTEPPEIEPMLQVAVKAWGRSVPGRWGMTHARQIKSGPSHVDTWALEPITVGDPPRRGYIFHLAGAWTESVNDAEADDSFPAVLAYIQSYCRLALNAIIDATPDHELVSCNTEGVWMMGPAERYLGQLNAATAPLEARIKATTKRLRVLSPQHHRTDDARLYSGVPRAAEEVAPDRFRFRTWPKLKGQIQRGDPRGYVREERTVNLSAVPVSRWAYSDGHCEPVEARWGPETGNAILPPDPALVALHGPLRPVQHPVLRRAQLFL